MFGDEVRGLRNQDLRRAGAVATIPTVRKRSLNLAQAVMVFGYEILRARGFDGRAPSGNADEARLATEALLSRLQDASRSLLLRAGFLNPQQPEKILDELMSVLRRAKPSVREVELLLALLSQLARLEVPQPRREKK